MNSYLLRFYVVLTIFVSLNSVLADEYRVVFRNKTSQALTTSVCAVHTRKGSLFTMGESASEGLARLAEDGAAGVFASENRGKKAIKSVATGNFTSANGKSNLTIESSRGRRISCVAGMLVATNDGFPAFLNLRLPRSVGQRKRFRAFAYDAGSEVNTESCEHVPGGPCDAHFVGIEEDGTIQRHEGIQGSGDLSVDDHGWPEPAVRGVVIRIK